MISENSGAFHEEILKGIDPKTEYALQLKTARRAVALGVPPQSAARSYQVKIEDLMGGATGGAKVPP